MSSKRKVHAVFEDGYQLSFDFNGWPKSIDPVWDTPEIAEDQKRFRFAYLLTLAGKRAGPAYDYIKIDTIWLESNGTSTYDLGVLEKL